MKAPLVLLDDPSLVATSARRLRESGHRVQDGFALPAEPFDLSDERLLCAGVIEGGAIAADAVLSGVRGCGLLIAMQRDVDGDVAVGFLRDLSKLGPVTVRRVVAEKGPSLTADQREVLTALAAGSTIPEAARELFISVRTAERRVAEARRALDVRTTAEAVSRMAGFGDAGEKALSVPWAAVT